MATTERAVHSFWIFCEKFGLERMYDDEYEELMRKLKEQELQSIYKTNLCFVCSNSKERPCFDCGRIRFTQKSKCLECCGEKGVIEEEETFCSNCDVHTTERLCSSCNVLKHIHLPSCLRCNGELSEGETGEREGEEPRREYDEIVLDKKLFMSLELLRICWGIDALGLFQEGETIQEWISMVQLLNVYVEYDWEFQLQDYGRPCEEWDTAGLVEIIRYPDPKLRYCSACVGDCVCFDPDINYNPDITIYTNL